jgi:deoxyribodipyrimidine photo-lyase
LLQESGAETVFAEEDYTPYARRRDARVASRVPLYLEGACVLRPPGSVLKANGDPYRVFTPFSRTWKSLPLPAAGEILAAPRRISTPDGIESRPIPSDPALFPDCPFLPGEGQAQRQLAAFANGDTPPIYGYDQGRDRLDLDGTSGLSPYLRFGMISARQAIVAAVTALSSAPDARSHSGAETWLNELIWREFYGHILHYYPDVLEQSFRPNLRALAWDNDETSFGRWCEGQTGYPVVDAAMRGLVQTGWMHNRARMIVASFLAKDLLIDWRWGERFFMEHLVDADPAANNGGWQWTAGTGTDAAPYFRIFNPTSQGKKHDPQGTFVRRWLPELRHVPERFVHEPWLMPADVQRDAGCVIGQDYAAPIVDHAWARERTLAAYGQTREVADAPRSRQ